MQTSQSSPSALPLPMRICCPQPAHHSPAPGGEEQTAQSAPASLREKDVLAMLDRVPAPSPTANLGSTSSTPHPALSRGSQRAHACNALQGNDGNRNPSEGLKERSVLFLSSSAAFSQVQVAAREHKPTVQEQPGCSQNSRFLPHFCTMISAAGNCFFQEGQAVPSVQAQKAQLARQASSSPLKQRNAGEGFSSFEAGMSDRQSSLLCSPVRGSPEELPHCSCSPGDLARIL